ncbi:MAG TPA: hypothetical protein VGN40_21595 [Lelliottia sp.]|jgi:hypothetical protein
MTVKTTAGNSLIFYTGKNEAGTLQPVLHGETGVLAASSASWTYQSVAMAGMQAFPSTRGMLHWCIWATGKTVSRLPRTT